jgi:hypothetical protein
MSDLLAVPGLIWYNNLTKDISRKAEYAYSHFADLF